MIDQFNDDGTGWARFSDDMTMRYRLARKLNAGPEAALCFLSLAVAAPVNSVSCANALRCVFLMLNPSTADAFKPDPTITECRKRAVAMGADVLEVVNLFALRSPYPADLRKCAIGYRGDDETNNEAILSACSGAHRVIAAWGNHGELDGRAAQVRRLLANHDIALYHLGTTNDGSPKHPLARGKHRIPADQLLTQWSYA